MNEIAIFSHMIKEKIIVSLFFLFASLLFRIAGPIIVNRLKQFHIDQKTGLDTKASWFFKAAGFFFKAFSIFCLVYVVLIWIGLIKFSEN
jgi:hypothetical protein